jgi:hypothetical protein
LLFFPKPYPDEFLYSLCARFQEQLGVQYIGHIDQALFCKPMRKYMFTFPHRIDYMASQLLVSPFVSAEDIIQNHTLLPFFLPFLSREKADLFYMGARGEGVGRTASRIRGERMGISSCRYCPECAAEDRKTYNEAYWHRLHQLPGITVCFKHGVHLGNL